MKKNINIYVLCIFNKFFNIILFKTELLLLIYMIYSVICKSKEDLDTKLKKIIKIELLDNTYNLNIIEKKKLFQSICEYIQVNYNFSYIDVNNNIVNLDIFKFCYLYFICENENIIDNTIYLPLVDINKYNWFVEQFEYFKYKNDINLDFKLEYNQQHINDYNINRLGNYRISITDTVK